VDKLVDEMVDKPPTAGRRRLLPWDANGVGPPGRGVAGTPWTCGRTARFAVERALEPERRGTYRMDSSGPVEAPSLTPDVIEFVRFCYRRRRVGWPELYDEMCAVAGRGLYRGWRFAELEEHGIGFSLHQTLELARIVAQVAVEEGDRRTRGASRAARRAGAATAEPVGIPIVTAPSGPSEPVIDVPIRAASTGADRDDPVLEAPAPSTPARPALTPSMIRSAAAS
jgi:hypothetical protein